MMLRTIYFVLRKKCTSEKGITVIASVLAIFAFTVGKLDIKVFSIMNIDVACLGILYYHLGNFIKRKLKEEVVLVPRGEALIILLLMLLFVVTNAFCILNRFESPWVAHLKFDSIPAFLISSISGCLIVMMLFRKIDAQHMFLSFIGTNSMKYYALHYVGLSCYIRLLNKIKTTEGFYQSYLFQIALVIFLAIFLIFMISIVLLILKKIKSGLSVYSQSSRNRL